MIDWIQKLTAIYGVGKVATAIITTTILLVVGTVFVTMYAVKQTTRLDTAVTSAKQRPVIDSLILCRLTQIETNNKTRNDSVLQKLSRVASKQEIYQNINTLKFNRLSDGKDELKRSFSDLDQTVRSATINLFPLMYEKKNYWNDSILLYGMIQ